MDDVETLQRLRQVSLLNGAAPEQLCRLASEVTWRRVLEAEEVVTHLDEDAAVYFISEGNFRAHLAPAPGRNVQIRRLGPGDHFGELAALAEAPRSVTVTAETEGVIARCPPEAFKTFIVEGGAPAYALAAGLARTIVSLTDRLFEASLEVRLRICAQLLHLLKSGEPTDGGIVIRNAPTHSKIGEAAGTTREAVTKEFSHLAALGILRQNKRELILDAEKLRELVRRQAGLTASQLVDW